MSDEERRQVERERSEQNEREEQRRSGERRVGDEVGSGLMKRYERRREKRGRQVEEERARSKVEKPGLTLRRYGGDEVVAEERDGREGGEEETAVEGTGQYLAQLSPSFTFTYLHKDPTWCVGLT